MIYLFFCMIFSPGSCFFLPHGSRVCNKLLEFIRSEYWKRGYEEVSVSYVLTLLCRFLFLLVCSSNIYVPGSRQVWTPNMYNMQLWETSGHAANYKENMFVFEVRFS